jgi:hypothetical protein
MDRQGNGRRHSSPFAATMVGEHTLCPRQPRTLDPKDGNVRFKYRFMSDDYESVNAAAGRHRR